MQKKRIGGLALLFTLMLALSSCGKTLPAEIIAEKAWKSVQENRFGTPQEAYIMRYTGLESLFPTQSSGRELSDRIRRRLPSLGYCVILDNPKDMRGFTGMHTLFLNTDEEVIYDFDYAAQYDLYEAANPSTYSIYNMDQINRATGYLQDCNYFAGMKNNAYDQSRGRQSMQETLERNTWYAFSDEQISRLFR